jgi:hypothetical protein
MKQLIACFTLLSLFFVIHSCQKETSFEGGLGNAKSEGTLRFDANDDCLPKTVAGAYVQGTDLVAATNFIQVDVNVTKTGSYVIFTDTVNGYYFRGTGIFTTTGVQTIKLTGNGTPVIAGLDNFLVQYGTSSCFVQVPVLATGGPAVFTLQGAGGACLGSTVNGSYIQNTALTAANTIVINANVTATGIYSITTTAANGMTFAASGAFTSTGAQTITLTGTGTPTATGATTISITAGGGTCTASVNVLPAGTGAAVFTLQGAGGACLGSVINGTYTQGTVLTAANTVVLSVDVTTIGTYSITSTTASGMTFTAAGSFTATGVQTVTLTGTGTPTAAGAANFSVTAGAGTCTFTVNVIAAVSDYYPRTTNSNWSYEFDDDPNDSLYIKVIPATLSALGNTYNIFMETADLAGGYDSSGYYRRNGGDYFQYFDLAGLGLDNSQFVEITFLKDNVAAGTTYTSGSFSGTVTAIPITFRFKFTITQKDVAVTVNGTSYPNTIIVEQRLEQNVAGNWIDMTSSIGYIRDYYSRNIGWILQESFDGTGTPNGKFEMRRHQVF